MNTLKNISSSSFVVLKFGGTSVSSESCWRQIAQVVQEKIQSGYKPIIVCSALTQISNMLQDLAKCAASGSYENKFQEICQKHKSLSDDLDLDSELIFSQLFQALERLVLGVSLTRHLHPSLEAQIMAFGEMMSTTLGAAALNKFLGQGKVSWLDIRPFMLSDGRKINSERRAYLDACCESDVDLKLQKQCLSLPSEAIITQGFIGQNHKEETVLLGRGGSDVSAAIIARKLEAKAIEIWSDVPGLFTTNPRQVEHARLLRHLDYDEALEIASHGGKALHPRCLAPLKTAKIPLQLKWTEKPDCPGTTISSEALSQYPQIKAVSAKTGIHLITMEGVEMLGEVGFLAKVFTCFEQKGLSIDSIATAETNVTVSLDAGQNHLTKQTLNELLDDLGQICRAKLLGPCASLTIVGKNIRSLLHNFSPTLEVLQGKDVYLLTQAANDLNLTIVIREDEVFKTLSQIHALFFESGGAEDHSTFGPTWFELQSCQSHKEKNHKDKWWQEARDSLLDIAKKQSPAYVYHLPTISERADKLLELKSVSRINYAVKANSHPEILKLMEKKGFSFDCVSWAEIELVQKTLPSLSPNRILFTPNFAPIEEYHLALEAGITITVDNLHLLENYPKVFQNQEIFLRLDPNMVRGHHRHVQTSGRKSKFGISLDDLDRTYDACKNSQSRVIGLHAHVGSGILNPETWAESAQCLQKIAEKFTNVHTLDLGGGLGIPTHQQEHSLDLKHLDYLLEKVKLSKYSFWLEPGRFLVSEAGVLLTRVTQVKHKANHNFLGVDAGMNSLLRPALYGAYHPIFNLSRLQESGQTIYDVVGPICESGDILGKERLLPKSKEGDVILIEQGGAYGAVMSSNYNGRKPALEFVLA